MRLFVFEKFLYNKNKILEVKYKLGKLFVNIILNYIFNI